MKKEYLEFIKGISSLSVSRICTEKGIDRSTLLRGKASEEKTKIVHDELLKQVNEWLDQEEPQQRINETIKYLKENEQLIAIMGTYYYKILEKLGDK